MTKYDVAGISMGLGILFLGVWLVYNGSFTSFFETFFRSPKSYNVIMISIDTLRADHMGVYGYSRDTSPNLDRFARENIMFEQAISQSTWTLPSHMSLFTSQYPPVHGFVDPLLKPNASKITLSEVLKQNGYATAAFVGGGALNNSFGFSQGFDVYEDRAKNLSFANTLPPAVEWLKQNKDQGFFLFVHGYDVHSPYHSPEPFENMFDPEYEGVLSDHKKFYLSEDLSDPRAILQHIQIVDGKPVIALEEETTHLEQRDIDHIVAHYDGGIRYTDGLIQQFLDTLKELDVYDNSIIIIFSDHGEALGDSLQRSDRFPELLIGHKFFYEEIIHVPLFIKHPALPAQKISTQAQLIDIFPTLLDFLDISPSERLKGEIQGKSLLPLIEGRAPEHFNEYVYGWSEGLNFVRTTVWKLAQWKEGLALYNLHNDPNETRNVIEQYPEVSERLEQKLFEWQIENLKKQPQSLQENY